MNNSNNNNIFLKVCHQINLTLNRQDFPVDKQKNLHQNKIIIFKSMNRKKVIKNYNNNSNNRNMMKINYIFHLKIKKKKIINLHLYLNILLNNKTKNNKDPHKILIDNKLNHPI